MCQTVYPSFFCVVVQGVIRGCLSVLSKPPDVLKNVEVFWKNIGTFLDKHQKLVKTLAFLLKSNLFIWVCGFFSLPLPN